ncbi:hypothetical protein SASPL_153964 [Salvia splendens]|uniref:Uncharacterized protein n=1 Tax=Salvia splendens TaxID=180675 RepID=A0A8X8YY72_SALSN|nr:hypothetical protein SASPL_153964 [Salvia splendens]
MSYSNRMWAAAGVAVANSLSDQGQKIKAGLKPLSYGKHRFYSGGDASDLRPLSAIVSSGIGGFFGGRRGGDVEREQKEDSLRQVMYLNCWGQG